MESFCSLPQFFVTPSWLFSPPIAWANIYSALASHFIYSAPRSAYKLAAKSKPASTRWAVEARLSENVGDELQIKMKHFPAILLMSDFFSFLCKAMLTLWKVSCPVHWLICSSGLSVSECHVFFFFLSHVYVFTSFFFIKWQLQFCFHEDNYYIILPKTWTVLYDTSGCKKNPSKMQNP